MIELKQSIIEEGRQYARMFSRDLREPELIVDLTLFFHLHLEHGDNAGELITSVISDILEDL